MIGVWIAGLIVVLVVAIVVGIAVSIPPPERRAPKQPATGRARVPGRPR